MNFWKENSLSEPFNFEINKVGSTEIGYLSVIQNSQLPYEIKRVYWTYFTPEDVIRGHHAHKELKQIIFAISGSIEFNIESGDGKKYQFLLDKPYKGIFIPPKHWREIKLSHSAVLLCLASEEYKKDDYIRSYWEFKENYG